LSRNPGSQNPKKKTAASIHLPGVIVLRRSTARDEKRSTNVPTEGLPAAESTEPVVVRVPAAWPTRAFNSAVACWDRWRTGE
jgi:hypothetical protein